MKKNIKIFFTTIPFYFLLILFSAMAQTNDFDSGSTGADGDLIFDIANGASQVFDHLADGHEGVWNFNQIIVPSGVTVTFSRPYRSGTPPVIWLAADDVEIHGTLNLNGSNGQTFADSAGEEAKGGPGGFAGGLGRGDGYGPGGAAGVNGTKVNAASGKFVAVYGNRFLQPLVGGSGGGGAYATANQPRPLGGGGGGGAILLSSSGIITITGTISANGGGGVTDNQLNNITRSGGGSGGGIRLVADKISGSGSLSATPNGRIALEAFNITDMAVSTNPATYYLNLRPTTTFSLPSGTIRVVDIDGNGVGTPALGQTQNPDVFFANSGQVTVTLECTDIPLGTQLTVVAQSTSSEAPFVTAQSTPLAGTLELSIATAQLNVPAGRGVIHAYASYDEN